MRITQIKAREILASGASPSLEVTVTLENGVVGEASVPYGASAGVHEATVLLDNDEHRYHGKGMLKAVENINQTIAPRIIGMDAEDQRAIDETMINLDGTENKSNLGGNAILGVSLAVARAQTIANDKPLYEHIRKTYSLPFETYDLPHPMMVVIEGGKHAANSTDFQEYLFSINKKYSVKEAVRAGSESYLELKKVLAENGYNTNVGNEGAFAPNGMKSNEEPFQFMLDAIKRAGYTPGEDIGISIDPATSEVFNAETGLYDLTLEGKSYTSQELITYFKQWLDKYPFYTVEDLLHEDDWDNWPAMTEMVSQYNIPHIGDDLTVTNSKRLQKAIDLKAITGILIKLNQIGTLTETVDTCMLAHKNNIMTVVSHRGGGETNDTSMIDLAVAVNSSYVKVGPSRGERVSKYNRLMRIEEELGR